MKRREFIRSISLLSIGTAATITSATALARVGRPASPNSVAGARRRQRRRRYRRVRRHQTLYTLPYGCRVTRVRRGTTYYYCSGIWYRPVYQGTTVVYIVDEIEPGADTNILFYE